MLRPLRGAPEALRHTDASGARVRAREEVRARPRPLQRLGVLRGFGSRRRGGPLLFVRHTQAREGRVPALRPMATPLVLLYSSDLCAGECWLKFEGNLSSPVAAGPTLPAPFRAAERKQWPWAVPEQLWPGAWHLRTPRHFRDTSDTLLEKMCHVISHEPQCLAPNAQVHHPPTRGRGTSTDTCTDTATEPATKRIH